MSNLRQAAQQALEALEIGYDSAKAEADQFHSAMAGYKPQRHAQMDADVQTIAKAITALRQALAEPEQEPVAWVFRYSDGSFDQPSLTEHSSGMIPLYTSAPTPRKPEPKVWCACGDSIEPDSGAKCGNCVAGDSAEPEQDKRTTVADLRDAMWLDPECADRGACQSLKFKCPAPAPRKPLTDEEIALISAECAASAHRHDDISFARAIERAHGIGEQT